MVAGPKLVLSFDDGATADWTKTADVLRDEDVPGCFGINSASVGQDGKLGAEQLQELEKQGSEILNHGQHHRLMAFRDISEPVDIDERKLYSEDRIYPEADTHGFLEGDSLIATDDTGTRNVHEIADTGTDARGDYVLLRNATSDKYDPADNPRFSFPDRILHDEIGQSLVDLRKHDLTVTSFIYPYDANMPRSRAVAASYSVAALNHTEGSGINDYPFDPLRLSRRYLETDAMTDTEVQVYLDGLADSEALGVLGGHSNRETVSEDRLYDVIRSAKARDIEIVTIKEALAGLPHYGATW